MLYSDDAFTVWGFMGALWGRYGSAMGGAIKVRIFKEGNFQ